MHELVLYYWPNAEQVLIDQCSIYKSSPSTSNATALNNAVTTTTTTTSSLNSSGPSGSTSLNSSGSSVGKDESKSFLNLIANQGYAILFKGSLDQCQNLGTLFFPLNYFLHYLFYSIFFI